LSGEADGERRQSAEDHTHNVAPIFPSDTLCELIKLVLVHGSNPPFECGCVSP
jgi:hypothetical protein